MFKILVVDDDAGIREVLRLLLTEAGFSVQVACDGGEAIEILQNEGGWLILLDLNMPRVGGRDVLTFMRLTPNLQSANRVILMSATARDERDYQALLAEVEAELPKPFDLDQVLALVHGLTACPEDRAYQPEVNRPSESCSL
jgi:CheY-like chemotaxis protein